LDRVVKIKIQPQSKYPVSGNARKLKSEALAKMVWPAGQQTGALPKRLLQCAALL